MIKLTEIFDSPYKYKHSFKTENIETEDEETGETYLKDVLMPVQLVQFETDDGIPYLWYARQNRHDATTWEIAFGQVKGKTGYAKPFIDIGITGKGNAIRVFATIIAITNSFINYDNDTGNYEVMRLLINSKEDNRTNLYLKRIIPNIENFKVENVQKEVDGSVITLIRTH